MCSLRPPNQTCFVQKLACREESTANLNILYIDSKKKEEKRILISVACKISCHVPWNVSLFRTGFSDVSKNNLQNILSALNSLWLVKIYRVNFSSRLLATFRPVFCDWLERVVRHFSEYRSNNVCMIKTAVVDLVSAPKFGKQTAKCTFRSMPQTLPQLVITTLDIRVTM